MCSKGSSNCGCDKRGGRHHWWRDDGLPGTWIYHATNNCTCGGGRCLPDDTWAIAIDPAGARVRGNSGSGQASYDPSYNAVSPAAVIRKLALPENCHVCNYHNPYIGQEHLTPGAGAPPNYKGSDMVYVCRTCKPAWDQKERLAKLREGAAEREYQKTNYSPVATRGFF